MEVILSCLYKWIHILQRYNDKPKIKSISTPPPHPGNSCYCLDWILPYLFLCSQIQQVCIQVYQWLVFWAWVFHWNGITLQHLSLPFDHLSRSSPRGMGLYLFDCFIPGYPQLSVFEIMPFLWPGFFFFLNQLLNVVSFQMITSLGCWIWPNKHPSPRKAEWLMYPACDHSGSGYMLGVVLDCLLLWAVVSQVQGCALLLIRFSLPSLGLLGHWICRKSRGSIQDWCIGRTVRMRQSRLIVRCVHPTLISADWGPPRLPAGLKLSSRQGW